MNRKNWRRLLNCRIWGQVWFSCIVKLIHRWNKRKRFKEKHVPAVSNNDSCFKIYWNLKCKRKYQFAFVNCIPLYQPLVHWWNSRVKWSLFLCTFYYLIRELPLSKMVKGKFASIILHSHAIIWKSVCGLKYFLKY